MARGLRGGSAAALGAGPGRVLSRAIALLVLAVPPAARWSLESREGLAGRRPDRLEIEPEVDPRVAVLEDELRAAREDLRLLGSAPRALEAHLWLADVLPLNDPRSGRSALWIRARESQRGFGRGAACLAPRGPEHDGGADGAEGLWVVGRVRAVVPGTRVAQLETTLDPGFRAAASAAGAPVIASGTGRSRDGRPLLGVEVLGEERTLEAGALVRTSGADGVFPPGLPIGVLEREGGGEEGRWVVIAPIGPSGLRLVLAAEARELDALEAWPATAAGRGGGP